MKIKKKDHVQLLRKMNVSTKDLTSLGFGGRGRFTTPHRGNDTQGIWSRLSIFRAVSGGIYGVRDVMNYVTNYTSSIFIKIVSFIIQAKIYMLTLQGE